MRVFVMIRNTLVYYFSEIVTIGIYVNRLRKQILPVKVNEQPPQEEPLRKHAYSNI